MIRYESLSGSVISMKLRGTSDPSFVQIQETGTGSVGVYAYSFAASVEQEIFFSAALPHAYREMSTVLPVVRWAPTTTTTGSIVWGLEYAWASQDAAFGNTSILNVTGTATGGKLNKLAQFSSVYPSSRIGGVVLGRLFRDVASASDTYADGAALFDMGWVYERDGDGSMNQLSKSNVTANL